MTPQTLANTLATFIDQHKSWSSSPATRKPVPPLMISGSPGIGKTSIVKQAARAAGLVPLIVDAIQRDAIELGGLPDIDRSDPNRPRTIRAVPDIVSEVESIGAPVLLLFDDFPSAPRLVQAACASALLERTIGGARLPDSCYVAGTGNLATDKVVYNDLPTNVHDRFVHVRLKPNTDHWCDWAIANDFHAPLVAAVREEGFQYDDPKWVNFSDPGRAFCTPRGLERVNRMLGYGFEDSTLQELVCGSVGEVPGTHLWARLTLLKDLPTVAEILDAPKKCRLPKEAGSKYVISRTLAARMREPDADAALTYIARIGREYIGFAFKYRLSLEDHNSIDKSLGEITRFPATLEYARKNPEFFKELNGK